MTNHCLNLTSQCLLVIQEMKAKSKAEDLGTGCSGNNFVANCYILIHVTQTDSIHYSSPSLLETELVTPEVKYSCKYTAFRFLIHGISMLTTFEDGLEAKLMDKLCVSISLPEPGAKFFSHTRAKTHFFLTKFCSHIKKLGSSRIYSVRFSNFQYEIASSKR